MSQQQRKDTNPEMAEQIENFLYKLDKYITAHDDVLPYKFIIDDPAGNSFIKNPHFPAPDPCLKMEKFPRTVEQLVMMGYEPENLETKVVKEDEDQNKAVRNKFKEIKSGDGVKSVGGKVEEIEEKKQAELAADIMKGLKDLPNVSSKYTEKETNAMMAKIEEVSKKVHYTAHKTDFTKPLEATDIDDQAIELENPCMNCGEMGKTRMCTCSIPYFKEIIVIAFTCDKCLHRATEVKTGGGISAKGMKYTIKVTNPDHLNRDIFKSESAEIEIPEIGCTVVSGSLGGVFSTVEGLLEKVKHLLISDARRT